MVGARVLTVALAAGTGIALAGCPFNVDYLSAGGPLDDTAGDTTPIDARDSADDTRGDAGSETADATDATDARESADTAPDLDAGSDAEAGGPTFCDAPLDPPTSGRWCDLLTAPAFCSDFDAPFGDAKGFYAAEGWSSPGPDTSATARADSARFFTAPNALRIDLSLPAYGGTPPKPSASGFFARDFTTPFSAVCVEFEFVADTMVDAQVAALKTFDAAGAETYSIGLVFNKGSTNAVGVQEEHPTAYQAITALGAVPTGTWTRVRWVLNAGAPSTVQVTLIPRTGSPVSGGLLPIALPTTFKKFSFALGGVYVQNDGASPETWTAWFDDANIDVRP